MSLFDYNVWLNGKNIASNLAVCTDKWMNEKMKIRKIYRNELYERVWKLPVSKLAAKYNLSDVGLAKICKKLNVPRPPRDYWTKLQFGKNVTRTSLPASDPNKPDVYEICIMPEKKEVFRKSDLENENVLLRKKSIKLVNVSKYLISPHPLVKTTKQILLNQKADDYGILRLWNKKGLDIRVSPGSVNRALHIMDAIIKLFESNGNMVAVDEMETRSHSSTYVEIRGEKIPFYIKEKIQRINHIPTEEEIKKQKKWVYYKPRCWDYIPTGKLTLKIDVWEDSRTRKRWSDTESKRVEDQIGDFLEGTIVVSNILRIKRKKQEEERAEQEKKRKIEQEEEERRRADLERLRNLEMEAARWAKSQQLRKYIKAIEKIAVHSKCPEDLKEKIGKWAKWAREHADRIDPLTNGMPFGFDPYDSEK